MKTKLIIAFALLMYTSISTAQIIFPVLSPRGTLTQWVGNTYVTIDYERPAARGREIFGGLVPYGEVWRTGAGYCTKIGFDQPVKVGNENVPAGRYSVFTIPGEDEWVIILNADTTLYGVYGYKKEKDIVRFLVKPNKTNRFYESLTLEIDVIPNDARVYLSWTDVQVSFNIDTSIDEDIEEAVRTELIKGTSDVPNQYALAAEYMFVQNTNLYTAIELADKAVALDKNSWARLLKIEILEKLQRYDEALKEIDAGIENVKTRSYSKKEYMEKDIQFWENHAARIRAKVVDQ